jgi:hypothetical protein
VKGDHTFVIFEKAIAVLLFAMKKGDHSLVVFENAIAVLFFVTGDRGLFFMIEKGDRGSIIYS